jgi:hypothetical protein
VQPVVSLCCFTQSKLHVFLSHRGQQYLKGFLLHTAHNDDEFLEPSSRIALADCFSVADIARLVFEVGNYFVGLTAVEGALLIIFFNPKYPRYADPAAKTTATADTDRKCCLKLVVD